MQRRSARWLYAEGPDRMTGPPGSPAAADDVLELAGEDGVVGTDDDCMLMLRVDSELLLADRARRGAWGLALERAGRWAGE